MTKPACLPRLYPLLMALWGLVVAVMAPALAQTPEQLALQQVIAGDPVLEPYYRGAEFQLLWSANDPVAVQRRQAFTAALRAAGEHGLPLARYDPDRLAAQAGTARQPLQHARAEAAYTRAFLRYARDLQSGVLDPAQVDEGIKRMAPRRDPLEMLRAFASRPAAQYLAALPPQTWQYRRLVEEKSRLEAQVIHGWGPVVPSGLAPEHAGVPVLALRQRLAAQGYDLPPEAGGAEPRFDPALVKTVQQFQRDHGLNPDGIVGPATLGELNKTPQDRLASVIAAMERERWMNRELGDRHVWVNLPDFSATILENGRVVLQSRAVIGKTAPALRTPEFSDLMSYLVINPSWTVPRSITVREYLPQLKANRYALPQLQVLDRRGRVLRRSAVNFSAYSARSFPYVLRQPPGADNALGRVKFMFPNAYSIYLHDTPAQALFARERRAFSHGCIRLARPQAFAHVLLGWQNEDPEAVYRRHLASGRETTVGLRVPVPVHIVYRTAFAPQSGRLQYRPDIYGRDAAVFDALTQAGVSLGAVRS